MAGYCTSAELHDWLNINDNVDTTKLDVAIAATTEWIDSYTGQRFTLDTADVTLTFQATNPTLLAIGPTSAITTVKTDVDGDGVFETTWAATDYELESYSDPTWPGEQLRAIGALSFPLWTYGRRNRVQVVGRFGWPEVPDSIRLACLMQAAHYYKRKFSPEGVVNPDFGIRVGTFLDPDTERLLIPYRVRFTT